MSAPIQITALEHALLQVEPLAYAAPAMVAAFPALLRLARAAQEVAEDGVLCQTRPCDSCDGLRDALAVFNFGTTEPGR